MGARRVRRELAVALVALAALAIGAVGAGTYARLALPYYRLASRLLVSGHPWTVTSLNVVRDRGSPGVVLLLTGNVRTSAAAPEIAAAIVSRLHVGAAIEAPLVFFSVLALWPASSRGQRWRMIAAAIPVWLALEVVSVVVPLLEPMASASAILAGDPDPLTLWERWSRFLEAGGRFALAAACALATLALTARGRGPPQAFNSSLPGLG
jgi:hypothetical protein